MQTKNISPESRMPVLNMIWLAMMASVGALGFIVYTGPSQAPLDPVAQGGDDLIAQTLGMTAVACAVASFILPKFFMNSKIALHNHPNMALSKDPEFMASSRYFTAYLVQQSLRESIAVFGFLLATTTHNKDFFLYFGGAALVLLAIGKPNVETLKEMVQKAKMGGPT